MIANGDSPDTGDARKPEIIGSFSTSAAELKFEPTTTANTEDTKNRSINTAIRFNSHTYLFSLFC